MFLRPPLQHLENLKFSETILLNTIEHRAHSEWIDFAKSHRAQAFTKTKQISITHKLSQKGQSSIEHELWGKNYNSIKLSRKWQIPTDHTVSQNRQNYIRPKLSRKKTKFHRAWALRKKIYSSTKLSRKRQNSTKHNISQNIPNSIRHKLTRKRLNSTNKIFHDKYTAP